MIRTIRTASVLTLSLVLGGCMLLGGSLPALGGTWDGGVEVQGQSVKGELEVRQEGGVLDVDFRAPTFGLVASGAGTVDGDGVVSLRLDYDLQCDGTAELAGRASADGRRIEGTITAADCTGAVQGTFVFTR